MPIAVEAKDSRVQRVAVCVRHSRPQVFQRLQDLEEHSDSYTNGQHEAIGTHFVRHSDKYCTAKDWEPAHLFALPANATD